MPKMDSDQAKPSKRRKTTSSSSFRSMSAEIRNMMYKCTALLDGVEPEERSFKTVTQDATIAPLDTIQSFYLDAVSEGGISTLFAKEIVQVTELTEEVLSLVMPKILFQFDSPVALQLFAETFAAYNMVCKVVPELHIELDFVRNLHEEDRTKLGSWAESELPHGRDIGMHDHIKNWMSAIQLLPKITHVHLVFSYIWRDFRELRGLSKKFGLSEYEVTFQFSTPSNKHKDTSFFEAQTIAAVKDLELFKQAGISDAKRAELVKFGCRGFNCYRKHPTI